MKYTSEHFALLSGRSGLVLMDDEGIVIASTNPAYGGVKLILPKPISHEATQDSARPHKSPAPPVQ